MSENTFEIKLLGRELSIKTDRSQEDIKRAVEFVESRYEIINSADLPVPQEKRLLLLALDLGLQVMDEKSMRESLLGKIRSIREKVEASL
jgi:cell division protein ZapA